MPWDAFFAPLLMFLSVVRCFITVPPGTDTWNLYMWFFMYSVLCLDPHILSTTVCLAFYLHLGMKAECHQIVTKLVGVNT